MGKEKETTGVLPLSYGPFQYHDYEGNSIQHGWVIPDKTKFLKVYLSWGGEGHLRLELPLTRLISVSYNKKDVIEKVSAKVDSYDFVRSPPYVKVKKLFVSDDVCLTCDKEKA